MAYINLPTWLAIALLIGGIFYYFKGKPAFGLKKNWIALILIAIAFLGGAFGAISSYVGGTSFLSAGGIPSVTGAEVCPAVAVTGVSAVRGLGNVSENYLASSIVYATTDGAYVASGTATGGATRADVSVTIPCTDSAYGAGMYEYAMSATTRSSAKSELLRFNGGTAVQNLLQAYYYQNLTIVTYDTSYTNTSSKVTATALAQVTQSDAVAVGSGGTTTQFIDLQEVTANTAYGSPHSGILFGFDNTDSAIKASDITLTSVTGNYALSEIPCSKYPNAQAKLALVKCYEGKAIPVNLGLVRLAYTIGASSGDPTTDPILYLHSIEYGQDRDGKIILDAYDNGGTTFGLEARTLTINLS